MVVHGQSHHRALAALLAVLVMMSRAEAQLYRHQEELLRDRRVTAWGKGVIPVAVIDGDELLTAWGPGIVESPGIALTRCSTGECRVGDRPPHAADLVSWTLGEPVRILRVREVDDVTVVQVQRDLKESLLGLSSTGQLVWSRTESPIELLRDLSGSSSTIRLSERYAVVHRAMSLDLMDLHNGQVLRTLDPEAVGLVSRQLFQEGTEEEPKDSSSLLSRFAHSRWFNAKTLFLAVSSLSMAGYLTLRRLASRSDRNSPIQPK